MIRFHARFEKLEKLLPPRRQVGVVIRHYNYPDAPYLVRMVRICFSDEPAFTKDDERAMDECVHAEHGPDYVGQYVQHPRGLPTP